MKRSGVLRIVGLIVFLLGAMAWAQSTTATISGTVKDSTGAVLPDVQVVLLNDDTGFSRTVQSDGSGRYLASSLPLGNYRMTATRNGYQTQVRAGVALTVGREAVVDMDMAIGAVTQTVEVTAEAPAVETTSSTVSGLVSGEQMRELPLNGRSYTDLALLNPGVIYNRTTGGGDAEGFGVRLSVNSGRSNQNSFLMDGALTNDHAGMSGNVGRLSLGIEGIREFRVLTHNFSAEYGRNAGAVVSAVTRSGTNQFHGSLFEFVRNNVFDARNFFNPGALPPFRRNQFGGAIGGPAVKDRIFFFFNYEGLRQRQGVTVISSVPDSDARRGFLRNPANGQLIQANPFNPKMLPYLNLYPAANGRNFGDGTAQSINDFSQAQDENYWMQRGDFRLADKDTFYMRYIYNPSKRNEPDPTPLFVEEGRSTNHFATISETHIFSANAVNDFRYSFNRTDRGGGPGTNLIDVPRSLFFNQSPEQKTFGAFLFAVTGIGGGPGAGGLSTLGNLGNGDRSIQIQNTFQMADSLSWIRGAHSLKFGFVLDRQQARSGAENQNQGRYRFGSLAEVLAGLPNQLQVRPTVLAGGKSPVLDFGYRNWLFGWFIQDDIRVSSRLTLNLGLRHEFQTDISEIRGNIARMVNVTDPQITVGSPAFQYKKANFAPRAGLSWDPTGSGKTAIRLATGVYYNQIVGNESRGTSSIFGAGRVSINNPRHPEFPQLPAGGVTATGGTATVSYLQSPLPTPIVVHYTLDFQRQITSTLSAKLGYIGWWGDNQTRITAQNIGIPQISADGTKSWPVGAPRINPALGDITQTRADTVANYNGLQTSLQQTVRGGLMFGASYTWGKGLSTNDSTQNRNIDNGGIWVSTDKDNPNLDYGRSGFDQRHTFVFNGQYQFEALDRMVTRGVPKALLGGWGINGMWQYGSGLPLNINTGFSNSRDLNNNIPDRPNLAPGASSDPTSGVTVGCAGIPAGEKLRTPERWFDPCAFVLPLAGLRGNLGRNTVNGPNFNYVSFTVVKNTKLRENMALQFRAEFFNLFNHPSFGLPQIQVFTSARAYTGNGGVITSTVADARQIQLGMKLTF